MRKLREIDASSVSHVEWSIQYEPLKQYISDRLKMKFSTLFISSKTKAIMQFKIIFIIIAMVAGDRLGYNRSEGVASHAKVETRSQMNLKQKQIELAQMESIIDFYAKTNPKMLKVFKMRLQQYYKN